MQVGGALSRGDAEPRRASRVFSLQSHNLGLKYAISSGSRPSIHSRYLGYSMYRLVLFGYLLLMWLLLSGIYDAFHITLGVISAAVVTAVSGSFARGGSVSQFSPNFAKFPAFCGFVVWLLKEIVKANFHVFKLAMRGGNDAVDPRIVTFRTSLKSDFAKFVLGNAITLTPGTVTLKIEGDVFTVHAVDEASAAGLPGEMERRVARVYDV